MKHWLESLIERIADGQPLVRVVVMQALGSTPREQGAVMLVDTCRIEGTIGGGELEWRAIARARELLIAPPGFAGVERWPLGPELGQCCGGAVRLWFERLGSEDLEVFKLLQDKQASRAGGFLVSELDGGVPAQRVASRRWTLDACDPPRGSEALALVEPVACPDPEVWIFGAGHVGRALAALLINLPFRVTVVDSRCEQLSGLSPIASSGLRLLHDPQAIASMDQVPAGATVLIMTHSHELDYQLCKQALGRSDLARVGLIGSETKGTCFRLRLSREGVADSAIAALVSPIGVAGVRSKLPQAIAVSVATQLLTPATTRSVVS